MISFPSVRDAVLDLADRIETSTQRKLVEPVTVPEPEEPMDELHFVRLVSWSYVLFNEAGAPIFREIARFMKSSLPEASRTYQDGRRDVDALRTDLAHNLPPGSGGNERKVRLVQAWFAINRVDGDWPAACQALLATVKDMIGHLRAAFNLMCDNGEGGATCPLDLLEAIDRTWAPHEFDAVIVKVAEDLGLPPFDVPAFRKGHQEEWSKLASLFESREGAEVIVGRIVRTALESIFGPS